MPPDTLYDPFSPQAIRERQPMTALDLIRLANDNPHATITIRCAGGTAQIAAEAPLGDGRRAVFTRWFSLRSAEDCKTDMVGIEFRAALDGLNNEGGPNAL